MHTDKNLENTYVIGDVHGCFHTLQNLVARLPKDAELIFVGDLCDKGKFSKEVIAFVAEGGHACVKGNHEYLMQTYLEDALIHDIQSPWSEDKRYGGLSTLESYQDDHATMLEHLEWVKNLPIYIEKGRYFITHGFALPYYAHRGDPAYNKEYLLNRYKIGMQVEDTEVINIFGHCVFDEVAKGKNFYGIDTGCSYGKKLTAIQLGTMRITQEPMDARDSDYRMKKMELQHLKDILHDTLALDELVRHIDSKFAHFDLISTEVASHIVTTYGEDGVSIVHEMLEKKQVFVRQVKEVVEGKV
ncbi:metallophosphoesterase [Sulfurovum sp.]|uniref:metallophosphoesterase n=1 Tax=Sulfurovum sp. TaxID=1969726 RepID=UPI0025E9E54E|nr:metallophosphoesterase [Sulfurovum sp.]